MESMFPCNKKALAVCGQGFIFFIYDRGESFMICLNLRKNAVSETKPDSVATFSIVIMGCSAIKAIEYSMRFRLR
jgi:hypothetical protein